MDLKKLCLDLAYSENEHEIISHLKKVNLWGDPNAWVCFGNNENNFGTIGNQQSKPESALVEKIINSVDAMLMSECTSRNINPESDKAPLNIKEALIKFYGVYNGKLSNISANERTEIANHINLVATGKKTNPCYSIIDKGEGQTPKKMPGTLLSLARSNKLRIPFVQGKFNMGGTGVFQFCGKHNIQLIISKRNPIIARYEDDESKNLWGFTIIRRIDPQGGIRNSVYKYLAPNQNILSFDCDRLPLLPGSYPEPYKEFLEWGTFIKLYEYQMVGLKTNILFDLYNRLSLLMPSIALPVRMYERRKGYLGHSFETTLSGLTVRLEEDRRENLEDGFPASISFTSEGQEMTGLIYAFKKGQSEKYMKGEGIIFTVNGQTHGYLPNLFFSKQSTGMGYISNSILITINCSNIEGRSREDLFMNSRDRLRSGNLRSGIEKNLTEIVRNHQGLKDLRERRRKEAIEDKLKDSRPLAEIVKQILKKSPTLSKLFISGIRISNPFKITSSAANDEFNGSKFPSSFKLIKEYPSSQAKLCHINRKFRIQYKTDAANDYFDRDSDPGYFILKLNGHKTDKHINLWNGIGTLTVRLPKETKVGEILEFKSSISDPQRIEPFEERFCVKVEEAEDKTTIGGGKRRKTSSNRNGNESQNQSKLDLPHIIEIRRENWDEHSFDEKSALKVISMGESGYDFFVNMDNIFLLTEIKNEKSIDEKLLLARYKFALVLIGLAMLKKYTEEKEEAEKDEEAIDIFTEIQKVTSAISPILLPMISSLGDLEIEEGSNNNE